jgi:hypothetical protein
MVIRSQYTYIGQYIGFGLAHMPRTYNTHMQ